jgi:hypothetical protein
VQCQNEVSCDLNRCCASEYVEAQQYWKITLFLGQRDVFSPISDRQIEQAFAPFGGAPFLFCSVDLITR